MSSERELDEGIKSIKSAWRREHTARANLEKMLEQAEAENAKLRELLSSYWKRVHSPAAPSVERNYLAEMRELGIEVDGC